MSETAQRDRDLLDRPVFESFRPTWWTVCYAALILFVVLTRLWNLAPRGYSHDESIHAWESWKLLTGQGKIFSRKRSGNCASHQRSVKTAVKRARTMGLLPYTGD